MNWEGSETQKPKKLPPTDDSFLQQKFWYTNQSLFLCNVVVSRPTWACVCLWQWVWSAGSTAHEPISYSAMNFTMTLCTTAQIYVKPVYVCWMHRYAQTLLQSSWCGRESLLFFLVCLPSVSWLLCGSSSLCHGFVCSLWLWYFLIMLTISECIG